MLPMGLAARPVSVLEACIIAKQLDHGKLHKIRTLHLGCKSGSLCA